MARETNSNEDNFPGSFLSDLAEISSIVNQDGNKMITDALFLGEITILKQVNNCLPVGPFSESHIVGSAGEGVPSMDIFSNESDVDIMAVARSWFVFERHAPDKARENIQCLQFDDSDTLPGYVKLKLIQEDSNYSTEEVPIFLSSSKVRNNVLEINRDLSSDFMYSQMFQLLGNKLSISWFSNGPSFSANIETDDQNVLTRGLAHVKSVDTVVALKCREWPKIAEEWIERRREFDWPGGALIEEAVEKGCYLVPIGGHQSQCEEMEWRISFVLAERLLIRNMNFIQRFVYSILKTIRKEIFGHFSAIISSYIVKTAVLWVSEENDVSSWKPGFVLRYVRLCFLKILNFLQVDFCPNFFMNKCNLFHAKYSEDERLRLIYAITDFVYPSRFLIIINNLISINNVRRYMFDNIKIFRSQLNFLRNVRNVAAFRFCSEDTINQFMDNVFNSQEEAFPEVAIQTLSLLLTLVKKNSDNLSLTLKETMIETLSCLQIRTASSVTFRNSGSLTLQQRFDILQHLFEDSKLQIPNLSVGGITQVAHAFFSFGCIEHCLELLLPMLEMSRSKPQVRMNNYMSLFYLVLANLFNEDMAHSRPVINIQFYPFELPMLTKDIRFDVLVLKFQQELYSRRVAGIQQFHFNLTLDPLVYACYMKFKCKRLVGDNIGSCLALKEFEEMVFSGVSHRYVALSLLGCCLYENGHKEKAVSMFGRSVRENKERLATYYHLAMLLNREMNSNTSIA